MQVTASAPGKLFLVGEYAVVESGHQAVLAAINRFVTVEMTVADTGSLQSSLAPDQLISFWREPRGLAFPANNPYNLVAKAMQVTETYLAEKGYDCQELYRVKIASDLDDEASGRKYGLGSSGAVTVATVKALLKVYGLAVSPHIAYKLAVLAQLSLAKVGSFGDIAASSFGGLVFYQSPDRSWLQEQLEIQNLSEVVAMEWKDLRIEPIQLPAPLRLLVGWTGQVAVTDQLLDKTATSAGQLSLQEYQGFLTASNRIVQQFVLGCQQEDKDAVGQALTDNRTLLQEFAKKKHLIIETENLQTLCNLADQHGAPAKTSGAGGGDCGICLVETDYQQNTIYQAWKEAGIVPLDVQVTDIEKEIL